MQDISKRTDQDLINLTSIRALYQEHLKDLEKIRNKEGSLTKIYELQRAISQRKHECEKLGYSTIMLDMHEGDYNEWLKDQLGKGVTP